MSTNFVERYPNPNVDEDRKKVRGAVIVLWVIAAFNVLAVVLFLIAASQGAKREGLTVLIVASAIGALLFGSLAALVQYRHSEGAIIAALVFLGLAILGDAMSLNFIALGLHIFFIVMVGRALSAVRNIKMRVLSSEQENPLVGYYHALIPLIVRVLRADGKVTPEEVAHFNSVCEGFQISPMERKILFDQAMRDNRPVTELVQWALEAGQRLGVEDPKTEILNAVVAAAAADRVLAPEEKQVLDKVAISLGFDPSVLEARLAGLQRVAPAAPAAAAPVGAAAAPGAGGPAPVAPMTRAQALQVLGLPETASQAQVQAAWNRAMAETDPNRYAHLGQQIMNAVAAQRRQVLAAGQVLLGAGATS